MSRLIDADALMRDINESLSEMTSIGIAVDGDWLWAKLNDAIEHAPTIEERKKGKWNFIGDQMFECSECGTYYTQSQFHQMRVRISDTEFPKFCPNCGARMVVKHE